MVPQWYREWMATNLRLTPELENALRDTAERSGRSQQEVLRSALRSYLENGDRLGSSGGGSPEVLKSRPPRTPFERITERLPLPEGVSNSLELLDR